MKKFYQLFVFVILFVVSNAQAADYNSFSVKLFNASKNRLVVQGDFVSNGTWAEGMQPKHDAAYSAGKALSLFKTESKEANQGNGGYIYLNDGKGGSVAITWSMPWNGRPVFRFDSEKYKLDNSMVANGTDEVNLIWTGRIVSK